jgi:uncharacterized protein involved in type VI secretion and phage assembly
MSRSLLDLLGPGEQPRHRFFGVVVGVVTNNRDPDDLGRVRVRFPWLSEEDESAWARVVAPMAGPDRGMYFLPEVDDEVVVAFEHGDMRFPYVIGAVWNGEDTAPESNDDGENNRRTIRSRSGHLIRFDDTDGGERIEIVTASQDTRIVLGAADNTIEVSAAADITVTAGGTLQLAGNGVEIRSDAGITVRAAADVDLGADGSCNVKGAVVNIN